MADYQPQWELQVFDTDDTTPWGDPWTSYAGGTRPYIDAANIEWRAEDVDVIAGTARVGEVAVPVLDKRAGTSNADRILTALLGDSDGNPQWNGRRARLRWRETPTSSWRIQKDGRLIVARLRDKNVYVLHVADDRIGLLSRAWSGRRFSWEYFQRFDAGIAPDYAAPCSLFPPGPLVPYGDQAAVAGAVAAQSADGLDLDAGLGWSPAAAMAHEAQATRQIGGVDVVRDLCVRVQATDGVYADEIRYFFIQADQNPDIADPTETDNSGETVALVEGEGDEYFDSFPVGTAVVYWIVPYGEPSESAPFHWDAHPATFTKDLLASEFGPFKDGVPAVALNTNTSRLDDLAADGSWWPTRDRVAKPWRRMSYLTEAIFAGAGWAPSVDADSSIYVVTHRLPDNLTGLVTLDETNVKPVVPGDPWSNPGTDAIALATWDAVSEKRQAANADNLAPDRILEVQKTVQGLSADTFERLTDREVRLPARAYRASVKETWALEKYFEAYSAFLRRAYAYGPQNVPADVRLSTGLDLHTGDFVLGAIPWVPDPATNLRGGTRVYQVLAAQHRGGRIIASLRDVGLNAFATQATATSLAANATDPVGTVDVGLTVKADTSAEVWTAETDTSTGTRPSPGSDLWKPKARSDVVSSDAAVTLEAAGHAPGSRVWVRHRAFPAGTGALVSGWRYPSDDGVADYVDLTGEPRILQATASPVLAGGAVTVELETNATGQGVRIAYTALDQVQGLLLDSGTVDVDASSGSATATIAVPRGNQLRMTLTPYEQYPIAGASGTPWKIKSEVRPQPVIRSVDLTWDDSDGYLHLTGIGGERCLSALFEISDQEDFSSGATASEIALGDGDSAEATLALSPSDRGKRWFGRVTPYNGELTGGAVTGYPGQAKRDSLLVAVDAATTVGMFSGRWINTYSGVSNAAPALLTDPQGNALDAADGRSYILRARNETTGKSTFVTLNSSGASWSIGSQTPTGGSWTVSCPEVFLDAGVPKVRLYGGTSTASVAVTFEQNTTSSTDEFDDPIALTDPGNRGRLGSGVADVGGRAVTDLIMAKDVAPASGSFFDGFDRGVDDWYMQVKPGVISVVSGDGMTGGKVIRSTGRNWGWASILIPFDPSKLYRIRVRVRRHATGDAANQKFYCGVDCIAADRTTPINASGDASHNSQHYNCISGVDASGWTLDEWQEFTGWFKGHASAGCSGASSDPTAPKPLYTGVAYFRPLFIANYQEGSANTNMMDIDYIAIDVFDGAVADNIAEGASRKWAGESGADVTAGKSLTTLVDRTADAIAESGSRKWAGESGADVTGGHTAASIAGQGALATQDQADFAVQVVGSEKPENNATVGAKAGTNLKKADGTVLGDADVVTAQGTAADTAKVSGLDADIVKTGGARASSALDPAARLRTEYIGTQTYRDFTTADSDGWWTIYTVNTSSGTFAADIDILCAGGNSAPGRVTFNVVKDWEEKGSIVAQGVPPGNVSAARLRYDSTGGVAYFEVYVAAPASTTFRLTARAKPVSGVGDAGTTGIAASTGAGTDVAVVENLYSNLITASGRSAGSDLEVAQAGVTQARDSSGTMRDVGTGARRSLTAFPADYELTDSVTQTDGVSQRVISKGFISGTDQDGQSVVFGVNFQSAPDVDVLGGMSYDPALGTSNRIYVDRYAANVSISGFDIVAQLRTKGTTTARSDTFASGQITSIGTTYALQCNLANAPAANGQYTVHFSVSIYTTAYSSITVKIETNANDGSGWVERASINYGYDANKTWSTETKTIAVSDLTAGDDVRMYVSSVVGSATFSVDPGTTTYTTDSGPTTATMTPDAEDYVIWKARAVST